MNSTIKTLVGDTLQSSDTNLNKTQKKTLRHIVSIYVSQKNPIFLVIEFMLYKSFIVFIYFLVSC